MRKYWELEDCKRENLRVLSGMTSVKSVASVKYVMFVGDENTLQPSEFNL